MDRSAVRLLTHPDPYSGIDSGRLLEIIIDIAGCALIEFEPECVIPEVCVETAGALGIAGCAVMEFDDTARAVNKMGWSSPLVGDIAGELVSKKMRSAGVDAIGEIPAVHQLEPSIGPASTAGVHAGIEAAAVVPLRYGCTSHGYMYLFGTTAQLTGALVAAGELVATVLGTVTGNAFMCRRSTALAVQLSEALESRVPIEQAKGLLAERFRVGLDEAFRILRAHSRRTRTPMARTARSVLDGGIVVMPVPR
ncbi:MAG: ANTAR domain-containing protein [Pseudonocardiaceae bacterium]